MVRPVPGKGSAGGRAGGSCGSHARSGEARDDLLHAVDGLRHRESVAAVGVRACGWVKTAAAALPVAAAAASRRRRVRVAFTSYSE